MFEQIHQQPNYWKGLMYACMLPHAESINKHNGSIAALQEKYDKVAIDVNALIKRFGEENEFILSHEGRNITGINIKVNDQGQPQVGIY